MGIVLKRKSSEATNQQPQSPVAARKVIKIGGPKPAPVVSQEDMDALVACGLADAPAVTYKTTTERVRALVGHWPALLEGTKVRITNNLYPWVTKWCVGDTATVLKYHTAPKEFQSDPRYACVVVRLDKARDGGDGLAYLHAWELEVVKQ